MSASEERHLANQLGDYVEKLRYEDLPPEVVRKIKYHMLDTIGVSLYGAGMPWAKAVYDFVKDQGGAPQSTVVVYGDKTSCTQAAFVNGTFAHSNDFDDNYAFGPLHPSAAFWTAIPLAERLGQGGRDVILSASIGYDVTTRLAEACFSAAAGERTLTNRGFQGQAVCGTLGSAVQACKQLGLDSRTCASALGIAGSYPGGTIEFLRDGTDTKRFHFGKASQQGITSAMLAANGFRGPQTIIEGHKGFLHAYSGEYDSSKVTEELGRRFDIMNVSLKKYPVMYGNETAIEAFLFLITQNKLKEEDVEEVEVDIRTMFVPYAMNYAGNIKEKLRPTTAFSATMSVPYNLAVAMAFGDVRLEHWEDENRLLGDERLARFAGKVKVNASEEFDKLSRKEAYIPSRVTIKTKDKRIFTETRVHPSGDPRNFMTEDQVFAKFRDTAGRVLSPARLDPIIDNIMHLDTLRDIRELMRLLC